MVFSSNNNTILLHDSFIVSEVKDWILSAGDFADTFRESFREQWIDIYQSIGDFDRWSRNYVFCTACSVYVNF